MNNTKSVPAFFRKADLPDYDCGDGVIMKIYRSSSMEELDLYVDELLSAGFSLYDKQIRENNRFYVFFSGDTKVFASFCECDNTVRIIIDNYTVLPSKNPEYAAKITDTVLYQFETDHSLIDCGMCYIVKCSDGSFFIIDSAHMYSVNDNDRIHDFLRSINGAEEKIHIAGWFFSHGHTDHICKFMDFLKYNMSDCVIDGIYYNFVAPGHKDEGEWEESERTVRINFASLLKEHPEIKKYKLHSGQHFYINELEFYVLATHEDVYPNSMSNFNDTSTALMMTYEGTRVSFPGDGGRMISDVMTSRYSDELKCDIMQVSHHGHMGCRTEFYEKSGAKTALFPNTRIKLDEENEKLEENRRIIELADRYYVSSEGTVGLPLPYKAGSEIVYPDETTENFDGIYALWGYEYTDDFKEKVRNDFLKRHNLK